MPFPNFFRDAPVIVVSDPLMRLLGPGDGVIRYGYADAVKLAGHSCPTVAGAFLMVRAGLKALYGDAMPERGAVRLRFPDSAESGVTGVMAQVAGLVTGARAEDGFKGFAGRHARNNLLEFDASVAGTMEMARTDGGCRAIISYNPQRVPADPAMRPLLDRVASRTATPDQERDFAALWQDRVRRILIEHCDDESMIGVVS